MAVTKFQHTLTIFRHGEADHNIGKFFNGNPQHPNYRISNLTTIGKAQVKHSAKKLKTIIAQKYTHQQIIVLHSPLPRTTQTAEIIAQELSIPSQLVSSDIKLIEADYGHFEGKQFSEFPFTAWNCDNNHDPRIQGENTHDITKRLQAFIQSLKTTSYSQPAHFIIVTHGTPALILTKLLSAEQATLETAGFITLQLI